MKDRFKKFDRGDAFEMFTEMTDWLAANQVTEDGSPNKGSVYFPSEDRFCSRDTACMARVFMRRLAGTGQSVWRERAGLARDYILRTQKPDGGFPEMRGRAESDKGSAVNTAIIAANMIKAYELGLDRRGGDLEALGKMADFQMTLEWKPGAFYHDTNHLRAFGSHWGDGGSRRDCQNTTALSAMMLRRVHGFLKTEGADVKEEWLDAAERAVSHLMEGQDPDGQWPYYFGGDWKDAGHHAMCMFYLAVAASLQPGGAGGDVIEALRRGARWLIDEALLQTKLGTKINWAAGRSACLYFTSEYFFIAAALARAAALDKEHGGAWRNEALEMLRYVRADLWDNPSRAAEGPFRLTEAGIKIGYAWFGQSMGWVCYYLDDLTEQMGWLDENASKVRSMSL